jgi:tetratricopeptide (TPR) repeat protein
MHGMSGSEFKIILATFLRTFPEGQLWANVGYDARGFSGYALLLGSPSGKIVIDPDRLEARLKEPPVEKSLGRWMLGSPEALLGCFIASGRPLRAWTKGLPVLDDDNPIIPFVTPWSKSGRVHPSILASVLQPEGPPMKGGAGGEASARFTESLPMRYLAMGHLLRGDLAGALEKAPDPEPIERYAYEKQRAAGYFEKLLTHYMDDERSLISALGSLRGLGAIDDVLPLLGKAAKRHAGSPEALFEVALSFEFAGEEEKAIKLYGQVLRLQPGAVPAMNNLALLLARREQYREALTLLKQSRIEDPWHDKTWIATGRVQMMRNEFDLALEALRRAEAISPDDPQIQNFMGLALSGMGDFEKAAARFRKAHRLDPFWEEPAFNAGFTCFSLKNYDEATQWFQRAVMLSPGDSEYWRHLGMALAASGRFPQAVDAYLAALRIDPQSDLAWLYLGFAYKSVEMEEDAMIAFGYALKINPDLSQSILTMLPPLPSKRHKEKVRNDASGK